MTQTVTQIHPQVRTRTRRRPSHFRFVVSAAIKRSRQESHRSTSTARSSGGRTSPFPFAAETIFSNCFWANSSVGNTFFESTSHLRTRFIVPSGCGTSTRQRTAHRSPSSFSEPSWYRRLLEGFDRVVTLFMAAIIVPSKRKVPLVAGNAKKPGP
jgi:hypothetical protein